MAIFDRLQESANRSQDLPTVTSKDLREYSIHYSQSTWSAKNLGAARCSLFSGADILGAAPQTTSRETLKLPALSVTKDGDLALCLKPGGQIPNKKELNIQFERGAKGTPASYGWHPLAASAWPLTSDIVRNAFVAAAPSASPVVSPGAQTPLHYEDCLMASFNFNLGPDSKVWFCWEEKAYDHVLDQLIAWRTRRTRLSMEEAHRVLKAYEASILEKLIYLDLNDLAGIGKDFPIPKMLVQHPGDLVLTQAGKGLHATFSLGCTIALSTNFPYDGGQANTAEGRPWQTVAYNKRWNELVDRIGKVSGVTPATGSRKSVAKQIERQWFK